MKKYLIMTYKLNLKADLDKKQKQDFINSLTNDDKIEKLSETYMSSISAINENVEEKCTNYSTK